MKTGKKLFFETSEITKELGLKPQSVYNYLNSGELRSTKHKHGKQERHRISWQDFQDFKKNVLGQAYEIELTLPYHLRRNQQLTFKNQLVEVKRILNVEYTNKWYKHLVVVNDLIAEHADI